LAAFLIVCRTIGFVLTGSMFVLVCNSFPIQSMTKNLFVKVTATVGLRNFRPENHNLCPRHLVNSLQAAPQRMPIRHCGIEPLDASRVKARWIT
jgi:hypothetical protein